MFSMEYTKSISVIMPTYNTPVTMLREAVGSILNQTFPDFELIIIDDCSTDESVAYLKSIRDWRVRVIRNEMNMGVTKALNVGLQAAKGKYIARMDSDDISLPQRLEKQFVYMEKHPDAVMCGSRVKLFGASSGLGIKPVKDTETYRATLLFRYPGPMHPTIFIRHDTLLEHCIKYNENMKYAQDYDLYSKIAQYGKIYIFPYPLLHYRVHKKQISSFGRNIQMECAKATQRRLLTDLLGTVTDEELDRHYICSSGYNLGGTIDKDVVRWYDKIANANKSAKIYDQKKLEKVIAGEKSMLVKASFKAEMSFIQRIHLCFQYLPLSTAVRTVLSDTRSRVMTKLRPAGGQP